MRSDEYARAIVGQALTAGDATSPSDWMAELGRLMNEGLASDPHGLIFELSSAAAAGFHLAAATSGRPVGDIFSKWALEQAEGNDIDWDEGTS